MAELTNEQLRKAELAEKLNEGHDSNYENYSVWQCGDGVTVIDYSNIDNSKQYKFNTDDIDTIVDIFNRGQEDPYCTDHTHYDLD